MNDYEIDEVRTRWANARIGKGDWDWGWLEEDDASLIAYVNAPYDTADLLEEIDRLRNTGGTSATPTHPLVITHDTGRFTVGADSSACVVIHDRIAGTYATVTDVAALVAALHDAQADARALDGTP